MSSEHTMRPAPLTGVRVIEISAFLAAPLGGMTLAQLGAEVIRIDPIGGNIDYTRWPVADDGTSIYWASLNKGKQSVTMNLRSRAGQQLATELIDDAGIVITNLPSGGWLDYEQLARRRADLIMLRLTGWHDGSAGVDYTVNAASGFPMITGDGVGPVNHALPAWDVSAGLYIAMGVLGAELERRSSGEGQHITIALSDVMLATAGNLGYLAEIQANGETRGALGNGLYGAYGQSFQTLDARQIMVVVISNRHWRSLGEATGLTERLALIGPLLDVDLATEGGRYEAREAIDAVLRPWFASRTAAEAARTLSESGVLQGVFQSFEQLVEEDPICSLENPLFSVIDQPGVGRVLTPGNPLRFRGSPLVSPAPAPALGESTDAVLGSVLGRTPADLRALRAAGIIAP